MTKKIHYFERKGQWVVFGKKVPRSVGLNLHNSAIKYRDYFIKKGLKPRIKLIK